MNAPAPMFDVGPGLTAAQGQMTMIFNAAFPLISQVFLAILGVAIIMKLLAHVTK